MRSSERTTTATPDEGPDDLHRVLRALNRNVAIMGLTAVVVGASYGAIAVGAGWPWWGPILASVVVFAGASQFMLIGLLGNGGSVTAAVLAGLLANLRHFPFGLAVADAIGHRFGERLVGAHLLLDESTAMALAQRGRARRAAYWRTAVTLLVCWNVGTALGVTVGSRLADPAVLGLDAAFPAALLALLLPALTHRRTRAAAGIGAFVAVALTPFAPTGVPILAALAGLAVGHWRTITDENGDSPDGAPGGGPVGEPSGAQS